MIKNNDNLCCARAICVSKAYVDDDDEYGSVRRSCCKIQERRAKELNDLAGIGYDVKCGIDELKKFQEVLPNY